MGGRCTASFQHLKWHPKWHLWCAKSAQRVHQETRNTHLRCHLRCVKLCDVRAPIGLRKWKTILWKLGDTEKARAWRYKANSGISNVSKRYQRNYLGYIWDTFEIHLRYILDTCIPNVSKMYLPPLTRRYLKCISAKLQNWGCCMGRDITNLMAKQHCASHTRWKMACAPRAALERDMAF